MLWWVVVALALVASSSRTKTQTSDVVVYGGTPGGCMAAVAAGRRKRSVTLLVPGQHVGGMSASGLGATDTGDSSVIGGYTLEFFRRNGNVYGHTTPLWDLEPHVAERIFLGMLHESNVTVLFDKWVHHTTLQGTTISSLETVDGSVYNAKIFIDSSYEGDVLASAKVSYTVGREGKDEYNETLAGRSPYSSKNQILNPINPYETDGKTLLPLMTGLDPGKPGDADKKVQAYNYRLCVTQNSSNMVAFPKPHGYNPHTYELFRRYVKTVKNPTMKTFLGNTRAIPNGKFDMNNGGGLSTDFIGGSWTWPEASYEERKKLWWDHTNYTQGLLWFMGHDPEVPDVMKDEVLKWGLCKDEFTIGVESQHWPWQLYVREGRRMVGDKVYTQQMAQDGILFGNASIGVAGYHFDSHNSQRVPCTTKQCISGGKGPNAFALDEGDVEVGIPPHELPYFATLPKKSEVTNLLVPVAVSASHIGFATIRLEPTWMILGHSVGTAADLAIRHKSTVQDVPLDVLRVELMSEGQILSYRPAPPPPPAHCTFEADTDYSHSSNPRSVKSAQQCCDVCATDVHCAVAIYREADKTCWVRPDRSNKIHKVGVMACNPSR